MPEEADFGWLQARRDSSPDRSAQPSRPCLIKAADVDHALTKVDQVAVDSLNTRSPYCRVFNTLVGASGAGEAMVASRSFGTLEPFRYIVVEMMNRKNLTTREVAHEIRCERTTLSKIRAGSRPITAPILEKLIVHLNIDRHRMVLAAIVMGNPNLYFDPTFWSISNFVESFMTAMIQMSGREDYGRYAASVAAVPRAQWEAFANHIVERLAERVMAFDIAVPFSKEAA